jgi:hypothetical protein
MTTTPTFTYEVNDNLEVRIWDGINSEPFLLQPFDPDTREVWKNRDEAVAFAEGMIAKIQAAQQSTDTNLDNSKKLSDFNFPQVEGFNPPLSPEQIQLIEQAKEDSERIKRIESAIIEVQQTLLNLQNN